MFTLAQTDEPEIAQAVAIAGAQGQCGLELFFGQFGVALVQSCPCGIACQVSGVAGRSGGALHGLLHGGQAIFHGLVARVTLQKGTHAGKVGGGVGQPVHGTAPQVLQLLGVDVGLLGQRFDFLHHGGGVLALVHAHFELRQAVAGFPGLLVQLAQLAQGVGIALGAGAEDLVVFQRQSTQGRGALREQLARQVGGLCLAACTRHEAHLRELFTFAAIDPHQGLQLLSHRVARVAAAQGVEDALGFVHLFLAQRQVAERAESLRRIGVHGQDLVHQLAGHVGAVLGCPHAGTAEQLGLDGRWRTGVHALGWGKAGCGQQGDGRQPMEGASGGSGHGFHRARSWPVAVKRYCPSNAPWPNRASTCS